MVVTTPVKPSYKGKLGGARVGAGRKKGQAALLSLEKLAVKEALRQRVFRAMNPLINSQMALAQGLTFLYRIDKTWVASGKNGGYWRNEKPVLVTSQHEVESHLEELAENNGDISDDKDGGAAYYFMSTKEPNNEALKDLLNRALDKPTESQDVNIKVFNLTGIARDAGILDGNRDVKIIDVPLLESPE